MAHEIDFSNDRANMAYVGITPWHGLGQKLTENTSIEEWKREAGMDWDILESPVLYNGNDGQIATMADKRVLYRSDTNVALSTVGSDYKVVQPGEVLEFFRDLVSGTDMFIETAGCLFGGKRFWAMANTSKVDYIGRPDDITKGYLVLATSSDSTMASVAQLTSVRVVCQNTLRIALPEKSSSRVRVTHRSAFDADMVKRNLGLYDDAWGNYIERCNRLASKKISDSDARAFIEKMFWTDPDATKASMQSKNTADFVFSLYNGEGMGSNMTKGNLYGVLNAITEHVDHHSRVRSDEKRAWDKVFGSGDKLKMEAFNLLLEMA